MYLTAVLFLAGVGLIFGSPLLPGKTVKNFHIVAKQFNFSEAKPTANWNEIKDQVDASAHDVPDAYSKLTADGYKIGEKVGAAISGYFGSTDPNGRAEVLFNYLYQGIESQTLTTTTTRYYYNQLEDDVAYIADYLKLYFPDDDDELERKARALIQEFKEDLTLLLRARLEKIIGLLGN